MSDEKQSGESSQDLGFALSGSEQQKVLIRKEWYQRRWFFSVIDIIAYLTDSENPRRYWSDLKRRVASEGYEMLSMI